MTKKTIAIALLTALCLSSTSQAADLRSAGAAAVQREVAAQRQNRRARADNPYTMPATLLMVGGGGLLLYGMLFSTGVACSDTYLECHGTRSKPAIIAGSAAIGFGTLLYMKGERARQSPSVVFGPGTVGVRKSVSW